MSHLKSIRPLLVKLGLAGIAAAASCWLWLYRSRTEPNDGPPRSFAGSSDSLKQTVVVPTLDSPLTDKKNAVWCSSFQIAWNHLKDDVVKEPIKLADAQNIADLLNQGKQSERDISANEVLAMAGAVKDGIEAKITKALKEKFPGNTMPPITGEQDGFVAVGYLKSQVHYKFQFLNNAARMEFQASDGRKVSVRSFGLPAMHTSKKHEEECRYQVQVLFRDDGQFAIDLDVHSRPNQVTLAKVNRRDSLASMVADLQTKMDASKPAPLSGSATLLVPYMNWRVEHDFRDLEGRRFLNAIMANQSLARAFQFIDLKMDRRGTAVESGALAATKSNEAMRDVNPDHFHFDQPFLLVMKKRDAKNPFLVMWIDNAELLCAENQSKSSHD